MSRTVSLRLLFSFLSVLTSEVFGVVLLQIFYLLVSKLQTSFQVLHLLVKHAKDVKLFIYRFQHAYLDIRGLQVLCVRRGVGLLPLVGILGERSGVGVFHDELDEVVVYKVL